jgi:hypothetical protein
MLAPMKQDLRSCLVNLSSSSLNTHTYWHIVPCIEYWMIIKDRAFFNSNNMVPLPTPSPCQQVVRISLSQSSCMCRRSSLLTGDGAGRELGRSQIIRPRKSLVLYKSFNNIWHCACVPCIIGKTGWSCNKILRINKHNIIIISVGFIVFPNVLYISIIYKGYKGILFIIWLSGCRSGDGARGAGWGPHSSAPAPGPAATLSTR